MRKPSGKIRPISAPNQELKAVQQVILYRALRNLDPNPSSFAYTKNLSVLDCAKRHVGARWVIKMDLRDFFSSVDERSAYRTFIKRGYASLMAFEMARICTRDRSPRRGAREYVDRYPRIPGYACGSVGMLPQGAPTSGALANEAARPLDRKLASLAASSGGIYTRYSDDLAFSWAQDVDRSHLHGFVSNVTELCALQGFSVHRRKTRILSPGSRKVILGLLVDESSVRLLPEFKRRVDNHIRCVAKFGASKHAEERGFMSIFEMVNHVDGCLAYSHGIEPGWTEVRNTKWKEALSKSGIQSAT
ncbi:reverse transcriptase family protein [Luteococcus japonicus]